MLPKYVPDQKGCFAKHHQVLGEDGGISRPESGEVYAWKLMQFSFEKVYMACTCTDGHIVTHVMQFPGYGDHASGMTQTPF